MDEDEAVRVGVEEPRSVKANVWPDDEEPALRVEHAPHLVWHGAPACGSPARPQRAPGWMTSRRAVFLAAPSP